MTKKKSWWNTHDKSGANTLDVHKSAGRVEASSAGYNNATTYCNNQSGYNLMTGYQLFYNSDIALLWLKNYKIGKTYAENNCHFKKQSWHCRENK